LVATGRAARLVAAIGLAVAGLAPQPGPAAAGDVPTVEARVLLAGHARLGSWLAISVHVRNDGPAVSGELTLDGGTQGLTRFGTLVDLPTQSDKTYLLYAQPPSFGSQLEVLLVDDGRTIATAKVSFTVHEATQTIVAVVAEHPERIVGAIDLPPSINNVAPLVTGLTPEDLPERVEAWGALDRVVWQDVDAARLTEPQMAALRGWVAAGGRLVVAGGTIGPRALTAFPDVLLPYRPAVTADVPVRDLAGLLGAVPDGSRSVPALAGELLGGRALATSGSSVVAAERDYGAGTVTLIGIDPAADWIAETDAAERLWRRVLPVRSAGAPSFSDDNLLVGAVGQLPSLALPSTGGLLALLVAYIVLIGPINYLVLKRIDRREWAWLTMPVLIVVFAAGAYGIGAALRGSELVVNEVAIIRGAPGATDGTAQAYLGIFSPSRGVYQVRVPGGALLSTPINGEAFGGGTGATLDVLQGEPSAVRNLAVGFGSLRAVRAETPVAVPLIETDLKLTGGRLQGTVRNASDRPLDDPALVLGGTVALLQDLAPGASQSVDVALQPVILGQSLADRIAGQPFFDSGSGRASDTSRQYVRHNMIDQLTYDPFLGPSNRLPNDGPVVLAWSTDQVVPLEIEGQRPNRVGNVLYYLPTRLQVTGATTFRSDLIRSTVVDSDAVLFSKDPMSIRLGRGSATLAYRPMAFDGRLSATELTISINPFDQAAAEAPTPVEPLSSIPPACPDPPTPDCAVFDGIPDIELLDIQSQTWRRLPHPKQAQRMTVADPARFVDAASGTVLVRFVNDQLQEVGAMADVTITGAVE
jgi:hypothetical protein